MVEFIPYLVQCYTPSHLNFLMRLWDRFCAIIHKQEFFLIFSIMFSIYKFRVIRSFFLDLLGYLTFFL